MLAVDGGVSGQIVQGAAEGEPLSERNKIKKVKGINAAKTPAATGSKSRKSF